VPGTSHSHFMEKPSLVNRIVLDFLDNDPNDASGTQDRGVG
jgi:hypothetical protein